MVDLEIDKGVISNFFNHFEEDHKNYIRMWYNPDFIVPSSQYCYSFSFLKEEVIVCGIFEKKIVDITKFDYMDFISDTFLNILLSLDSLPSRLARYKRIGLQRLRKEIIDELQLGGITTNGENAYWNDYDLKISFSSSLYMDEITFS